MADNVSSEAVVSAGQAWAVAVGSFSGDTIGVPGSFQIIASGSEGAWTFSPVVGGAGAVSAGVQRMTLASDDPAVVSVQIMDDWDESDRAKVNLIVGQAGIAAGAGAVGATVPRVTFASDAPGISSLTLMDDVIYVDGAAFVAGLSSGSLILANRPSDDTLHALVVGGGTEAAALRVTIASDSTGVVSIDDNGAAITVDNGGTFAVQAAQSGTWNITNVSGTVSLPTGAATAAKQPALGTAGTASSDVITVQGIASMTPLVVDLSTNNDVTVTGTVDLGATDNAVLDAIAASLALLDNSIAAGNEIQVDVVAALPAGTNNIGDVDAIQSGTWTVDLGATDNAVLDAIAASLTLLDDTVYTDDAAFTPGTSKVLAIGAQADEDSTDSVDEGDVGALRMTLERKLRTVAALDSAAMQSGNDQVTPKFAVIAASSSGDNTLVAAVASKKLRVLSLFFTANGTVTTRFESGAGGTALTGQSDFIVNTGMVLPFNPVGWFETAANTLLNLELSGAVEVAGGLTYIEVD